ncbi:hypothetical protein VNI00_011080 [Paramarasmius palmivorus]|uniref:Uncharacterized protein n=1 Tax=Paramarasmius palmivorus TaxID=297713 RepID=A0AAW0CF81_9AGAR
MSSRNGTPTSSSSEIPSTPALESDISTNSDSTSGRRSMLRASVFDVFLQLGGLEENSQIADWMFNDDSDHIVNSSSSSYRDKGQVDWGTSTPYRFREKTGSRFRERLGSDAPDFVLHASIWDDDNTESSSPSSNKLKFMDRVRTPNSPALSHGSGSMAGRRSTLKFAAESPTPRDTNRKSFFLFRSRSTRHPRMSTVPGKTLEAVVDSEDDSFPSSSFPAKNPRLSLFRTKTHPPPMVMETPDFVESPVSPASITSEWERVDPLSTIDFQTLTNTDNPFLHGNGQQRPSHSQEDAGNHLKIPFPSGVDLSSPKSSRSSSESDDHHQDGHHSTLMQRLSVVVTRPFQRHSHHHHQRSPSDSEPSPKTDGRATLFATLRRTQSNTAPDTSTQRAFLMSAPSSSMRVTVPQMMPLTNSMSHS